MEKPSVFRRRLPQLFAAISATLGGFSLGTVLGWTSPAFEHLKDELSLSEETISWMSGVMPLGALLAMLTSAFVLDRLGRRLPLLCTAPPFVMGWMLLAFFGQAPVLLIGRIITGFCGGLFCTAAPVYTGEISEKEIRGSLGVCFQLMVTAGILYVFVVGKWANLMWLSLLCAIPPVVFFVLFFFVPESPMFLLSKDKTEKATDALHWLRGGKNADITADLAEMNEAVTNAQQRKGTLKDMFSSRAALRGLGIGVGLQFAQQLSGINVIIFYTKTIFQSAGTTMDASDSAIIVGVVQVVATLAAALLVECAGRRIWLMLSMSGMGICLVLMGVFFYLKDTNSSAAESIGWLPLLSMCCYLCTFSVGAGPLPWSVIGEIFPGEVKGIASAICGATNWTLAFIVSKTFLNLVDLMGAAGTFWMYATICFIATVWIFFCVLETRNKTLDEITKELIGE